ncbi:hypothetical protein [Cellulosimicrobium sp. NPDC057862]|uniref:hypothetical protein n=1 Tax=Cellulosimicrobium sp. NPDC057862 TaxID=3346266 RepID=UPI003672BCDD
MTTTTSGRHASAPAASRRQGRILRAPLGIALVVLAGWVVTNLGLTQTWEAHATARLLHGPLGQDVWALDGRPVIRLADTVFDLHVTVECAGGLVVAPFLVLGGVLLLSRRFSVARLLVGTSLACLVVLAVNQMRLALIGYALIRWGAAGYGWSHTVVGSVLTLLGVAVALVVLWMVALRGPRKEH